MNEHVNIIIVIIITNLTLCHICLYWSQFLIVEYMRCQLITTRYFDISLRLLTVFVLFFDGLYLAISLADNTIKIFFRLGV